MGHEGDYELRNNRKENRSDSGVRINITLKGEPARWMRELKLRGRVISCRDAVIQALEALHENVLEKDLKEAQLHSLRDTSKSRAEEEAE